MTQNRYAYTMSERVKEKVNKKGNCQLIITITSVIVFFQLDWTLYNANISCTTIYHVNEIDYFLRYFFSLKKMKWDKLCRTRYLAVDVSSIIYATQWKNSMLKKMTICLFHLVFVINFVVRFI